METNLSDNLFKLLQSNVVLYCAVLILAFKIMLCLATVNFPLNIFFADITKASLKNLVNQTRQSNGLQPLAESQKLNQAAMLKAENMVQNQYFNHTSPGGITPWHWFSKAGYEYKYAGENLAIGFYESQEVYNAWLNSSSHKANLLNPNYKEIGTAVLKGFGENNATVVVQLFGSQKISAPSSLSLHKKDNSITAGKETGPAPALAEQKVLAMETPANSSSGNASSNAINFMAYDYPGFLEDINYGISLVMIGIFVALIFFSAKSNFKERVAARPIIVLALLAVSALINKEAIISIIPHQISI